MPTPYPAKDPTFVNAITSKAHLIQWLEASDRKYIVMNARHFVEALPDGEGFQNGVEMLQQLLSCYRDYRMLIPTGYAATITEGIAKGQKAPIMLDETFSSDEWSIFIEWAQDQRARAQQERTKLPGLEAIRD